MTVILARVLDGAEVWVKDVLRPAADSVNQSRERLLVEADELS